MGQAQIGAKVYMVYVWFKAFFPLHYIMRDTYFRGGGGGGAYFQDSLASIEKGAYLRGALTFTGRLLLRAAFTFEESDYFRGDAYFRGGGELLLRGLLSGGLLQGRGLTFEIPWYLKRGLP